MQISMNIVNGPKSNN